MYLSQLKPGQPLDPLGAVSTHLPNMAYNMAAENCTSEIATAQDCFKYSCH